MRPVYVLGVGAHPWGKFPDKPQLQLAIDALSNALRDARLADDPRAAVEGPTHDEQTSHADDVVLMQSHATSFGAFSLSWIGRLRW